MNYEGSQSHIQAHNAETVLTIENSQGYYGEVDGWKCTSIVTDLESGTINEFIKKEGKWFNYIKGSVNATVDQTEYIDDTSRFSVQGIGTISSIQEVSFGGNGSSSSSNGNGGVGGVGRGGGY